MGGGHTPNPNFWKKAVFLGALPAVAIMMIKTFMEISGHEHERQEFVPYSHLRLRNKRYPWGDGNRTFFHNKKLNPLPEGYEDDE